MEEKDLADLITMLHFCQLIAESQTKTMLTSDQRNEIYMKLAVKVKAEIERVLVIP